MEVIVATLCGMGFGLALDKAKTNVPWVVMSQMNFSNNTMMRMFLGASATSTLSVLLLDQLGLSKRKPRTGNALGMQLLWGFGANIVGGALLGMGMALTGSCPGTVFAQIGAGMAEKVSGVIAGCFFGAILHGYVEKQLLDRKIFSPKETECDLAPRSIGYRVTALLVACGMFGAIYALDSYLFPWQNETMAALGPLVSLSQVWDPLQSGILLGLIQIPSILCCGMALGQSSGWAWLAGNLMSLVDPNLKENAPSLYEKKSSSRARAQVMVSAGIMIGAALSQYWSEYPQLSSAAANGFPGTVRAFTGGVLLLFGSRLGGGCTSGHGLSGVASLSAGSMISVMAMFAGGIPTQLLLGVPSIA